MTEPGKLWLVSAEDGTLERLSVQGRELLAQATVVGYYAEQQALLEVCAPDVVRRCLDGAGESNRALIEDAARGQRVLRLVNSAQDTCEALQAFITELERAGVAYATVPGVVALPTTAREAVARLRFVTSSTESEDVLVLRPFDSGALFGKRLLLPRPLEQSRESAALIRAYGAIPVVFPLLSIEEPDEIALVDRAVENLASYDWVLLTSANGAAKLIQAVERAGKDARAFGSVKIGVIGPKTAEPLRRFGLSADLVAEEHVAEGLLLALASQQRMHRVLLFRAAEAREVLPESLRAQGITVDVVAGYRTRRLGNDAAEPLRQRLREGALDAVLVTSSSMATSLVEALGDEAPALLARTIVASIGPVTTKTLERWGVQVTVCAQKYTVSGLLSALEREWVAKGANKPC
jgi:uroporphyrinogen-III synthase